MFHRIRSHVATNAVGYIAVFLALGGTSYAAATGSIDSRELKNNTVRSKDVRNNDVRSKDVRNGSLLARDFKPGQLPAGAQGPSGATNVTLRVRSVSGAEVTATCAGGEKVVGGGADGDVGPFTSFPTGVNGGPPTGWRAKSESPNPDGDEVKAFVVCARP